MWFRLIPELCNSYFWWSLVTNQKLVLAKQDSGPVVHPLPCSVGKTDRKAREAQQTRPRSERSPSRQRGGRRRGRAARRRARARNAWPPRERRQRREHRSWRTWSLIPLPRRKQFHFWVFESEPSTRGDKTKAKKKDSGTHVEGGRGAWQNNFNYISSSSRGRGKPGLTKNGIRIRTKLSSVSR